MQPSIHPICPYGTFKVQVQESSSSSIRDVDPSRLQVLHFGLELGTCA